MQLTKIKKVTTWMHTPHVSVCVSTWDFLWHLDSGPGPCGVFNRSASRLLVCRAAPAAAPAFHPAVSEQRRHWSCLHTVSGTTWCSVSRCVFWAHRCVIKEALLRYLEMLILWNWLDYTWMTYSTFSGHWLFCRKTFYVQNTHFDALLEFIVRNILFNFYNNWLK